MKAEDALLILTLLRESGYWPHLLQWRDAAVAAEREACAGLADAATAEWLALVKDVTVEHGLRADTAACACRSLAIAVRARGKT